MFGHGPPFHRTDVSSQCSIGCIDEGFIFCKTDNSRIGLCCNPEECAGKQECSSSNLDPNAKYLFCPYENTCGPQTLVAGNEQQSFRFDLASMVSEMGSICNYELQFPENAAWGSQIDITVVNTTSAEIYLLTGSSIQTARSGSS